MINSRRGFLATSIVSLLGLSAHQTTASAELVVAQNLSSSSFGVPFLQNNENIQEILSSGTKVIVLDPNQIYEWSNIYIPSGVTIIGNGAVVKSTSMNAPIFNVYNQKHGVTIYDVNFDGNLSKSPYNQPVNENHLGIQVYKSSCVTIDNCRFINFLGAGISMFNHNGKKRATDMKITNCRFVDCQYGWVGWYNSEYGVLSNNHFTNCRVGIWNCSGNWLITGNVVTDCRAAYVVTSATNEIAFNTGGNFSHGNVTGNTFNHCNQSPWGLTLLKYGNTTKAVHGVHFDSVLPVTFTGNALWYTDFTYENSIDDFFITGSTFSNCNVNNNGNHLIQLTGCWTRSSVNLNGNINVV